MYIQEGIFRKFWEKKFLEWNKESPYEIIMCKADFPKQKRKRLNWAELQKTLIEKGFACELSKHSDGRFRKRHDWKVLTVEIHGLENPIEILNSCFNWLTLRNNELELYYQIAVTDPNVAVFYFEKIRENLKELLESVKIEKAGALKMVEAEILKENRELRQKELEKKKNELLATKYRIALYEICPLGVNFDCVDVKIPESSVEKPVFCIEISSDFSSIENFSLSLETEIENDEKFEALRQKLIPILNFFEKKITRPHSVNWLYDDYKLWYLTPPYSRMSDNFLAAHFEAVKKLVESCDFPIETEIQSAKPALSVDWKYGKSQLSFYFPIYADDDIEGVFAEIKTLSGQFAALQPKKEEIKFLSDLMESRF